MAKLLPEVTIGTLQTRLNPCKCGFHGDPFHQCLCTPHQIQTYRSKVSGPLMDRIDIHIEVPAIKFNEIASDTPTLKTLEKIAEATGTRVKIEFVAA